MSAREMRLRGILYQAPNNFFYLNTHPVVLLTDALDDGPVFLSEQVRSEMFFSSDVLRTTEVQICVTSQKGTCIREREHCRFTKDDEIVCFSKRVHIPIPSQRSTTVFAPRTITS